MEYSKATDFSGLTWIGGDGYYAVSNRTKALFPMKIAVNRESGRIESADVVGMTPVKSDVGDFEGIAWMPEKERLYISSEAANAIVGYDREADARFSAAVPPMFQNARRNKGLESLTYGAGAFWTANEDALSVDGAQSSPGKGALVRLQKMDSRFRPLAQYAYRTEPSLLRASGGGTGVTDLCALPDGSLLVLERVVGLGLEVRIFLVDFEGASDTSALATVDDESVKPVRKRLLLERSTATKNFEGIALGPELKDGWRSLLLIADSGGEATHFLMPLRVRVSDAKK